MPSTRQTPPLDYTRAFASGPGYAVWLTRPPADAAIQQVYRLLLDEARRKASEGVRA